MPPCAACVRFVHIEYSGWTRLGLEGVMSRHVEVYLNALRPSAEMSRIRSHAEFNALFRDDAFSFRTRTVPS
eukprot:7380444-Prymnesium_polylepis.2